MDEATEGSRGAQPSLRSMRVALATAATAATFALAASATAGEVDLVRSPSLSPDGAAVVFSWRGDLWWASTSGGRAVRLTSHPADESRSAWSPDGRTIAFETDRSVAENVWLMDADGANVRQLTREDAGLVLTGWTHDGAGLTVVSRRAGDFHPEPRPFSVPAAGGPFRRLHDAFGREAVVSPDGSRIAFVRGGSAWTRRGYRGADSRDVWTYDVAAKTFARVTSWAGNDGRPQWAGDGALVFTSDRELGTQNVWRLALGAPETSAERLTAFEGQDVWDLAVSRDGRTAVCVVWGRLHRIDLTATKPAAIPVALHAADDEGDRVEVRELGESVSEAQLSPDGKTLAVVAFGEVLVRNVEEKHPTRRVTATYAREREIAWSPDGMRLWFVSDEPGRDVIRSAVVKTTRAELRAAFDDATGVKPKDAPRADEEKAADDAKEGDEKPAEDDAEKKDGDTPAKPKPKAPAKKSPADRWQDAVAFTVETVVDAGAAATDTVNVRRPLPSPDGRHLAYRRGGDLVVLDLETKASRVLLDGFDTRVDARWSPDSAWIAYATDDRDFNADVWVVRADGSAPAVNVSRHPANDGSPRWSADGRVLAFLSERSDHEVDVWRVLLDRKLEAMPPEEFAQWQKDAVAAAKKRKPLPVTDPSAKPKAVAKAGAKAAEPAALDLDDAWKRLVRVTTLRGDESNLEILPGGDGFVFRGKNGSEDGLFACNFDGGNLRRLAPGAASAQQVTLTGDAVVIVSGSKAATVPPAGGAAKALDVGARVALDREEMAAQRFVEAARIVGDVFYDGTMKGLDWPAQTQRYLALARRTRTADDFNFVAASLLGELNASHLGIRMGGRTAAASEPNGRLGVDAEPVPGGFRITAVLPYGPADKGPMKLAVGDVVTSVDGRPIGPADTLESAFAGRVGRETLAGIRRAKDGVEKELAVLVTPISAGADSELRYDAWTARNEAAVHRLSQDRLGYLHIRQMSRPSLEEFERDLYAAAAGHDGLVIDVRNNGGGHTADHVLASLMVQPHAYTVPRGADPGFRSGYPRDRLYIQRYVLPANLLCNEKSFSNAEILSHAFKTLRRGTLVGQETHGGVISTGAETTLDGTVVRTPFRGWYLADGTDMENHGARPDLLVPQTPEAESRGDDEQLAAAVADLLRRLPTGR